MGALSFASPLVLTALLALPLVWLILRATPPSPQTARFPAFIILKRLENREETPARTPWPLLLLRLFLAAIVILALAGPILNAPDAEDREGPLVVVIDDTFAAAPGWRARRDAVIAAAAEAESADRAIYLAPTAPAPNPSPIEPLTADEARDAFERLTPKAYRADRRAAAERLAAALPENAGAAEIRWLTDGLAGEDDAAAADAFAALGDLAIFAGGDAPSLALRAQDASDGALSFTALRLSAQGGWEGAVVAQARDGRELARRPLSFADDAREASVEIDLPLALRNALGSVRIENARSAAAVRLIDARDRRALVGLVSEGGARGDRLLDGAHYLREALDPHAEILEGSIDEALSAGVSVIVLDDVGALRDSEETSLSDWIERGGVLIRFAGPVLAEAAQDRDPPLIPAPLRGGGRAFGGALTWETPQRLDAFPAGGPFADLTPADDIAVRRQVLAQPGGETTLRTWARLEDGTPLVTGAARGAGALALFHVTATPSWSDLPISGLFVDMLRRLIFLSALGPEAAETDEATRYAPLQLLDGYGRLERPDETAPALTSAALAEAPGPERPPGLYGAPDAPLALNALGDSDPFEPIALPGFELRPYAGAPVRRLAPPLFMLALLLLLIDAAWTLLLAGGVRAPRRAAAAAALALFAWPAFAPTADAQPLDPRINSAIADAALTTRLAYVETGDPAVDRLSNQALAALSRELYRRTALEPGPPAGVDPETDDLSVYPFLYWPVTPDAPALSEAALVNIENFMRFGGLVVFDTRDDERAVGAGSTPERQSLQRILGALNVPPLIELTDDHVLTRSFYLTPDLFGRLRNHPVWVAAEADGANDGVTPIIIGGRDWAGAWATDEIGRPLRPMSGSNPRMREYAYRAGVNMVMVAFTGNYKSDQVHTPTLLRRLGR